MRSIAGYFELDSRTIKHYLLNQLELRCPALLFYGESSKMALFHPLITNPIYILSNDSVTTFWHLSPRGIWPGDSAALLSGRLTSDLSHDGAVVVFPVLLYYRPSGDKRSINADKSQQFYLQGPGLNKPPLRHSLGHLN